MHDGQGGDWLKGRTVWVAVDDVAMIAEFADLAQLKKSYPKPNL